MSFNEHMDSDPDHDAKAEFRLEERRRAFDDVYAAAADANFLDPDSTPILDGAVMARLAYRLHEDAKANRGRIALPAVAKLRRAWDELVAVDDEANAIDNCAIADVYEERGQELPFVPGLGGSL